MYRLSQDLRFAIRTMLKKPGFTLTSSGHTRARHWCEYRDLYGGRRSIAARASLQIARSALSPLGKQASAGIRKREFSYPDYQDYQKNNSVDLAAYTGGGGIMSGRGEPELVFSPRVSANFFSLLGVDPVIGRTFPEGEDKQGSQLVTVLTYGMWQSKLEGDTGIIGQPLTINGQSYTVIGVLPANFQFALRNADLFVPYQPNEAILTRRFMHGTNLIGRLKPGVTIEQANNELSIIASRIEKEHNQSHAGTGLRTVPLQEEFVGKVKPILFVLLGAVGFVLLIVCANVASLLLTRSLSPIQRGRDSCGLGASRWRVVRQMLTESVLLSLVGGLAGLLIAYWGLDALVAAFPEQQLNSLPFLKSLSIDTRILGFSFALSALTGIVFWSCARSSIIASGFERNA